MRKEYKASISVGLLVGVLFLSAFLVGWANSHWSLGLQNTSVKDVLNLVLTSHKQWATVQGEATVIWYGGNGETQSYTTEFAFQQPGQASTILTDAPSFVEKTAWISNGVDTYEINLQQETYSQGSLPEFVFDTSYLPISVSETSEIDLYLHPLALLTPSIVSEYIFPHGFAQGSNLINYELVGDEIIIGRDAWVMNMTTNSSSIMAWVDKDTGVILKYVQENNGKPFEDFEVNLIFFDSKIPESTFTVPDNLTQGSSGQ